MLCEWGFLGAPADAKQDIVTGTHRIATPYFPVSRMSFLNHASSPQTQKTLAVSTTSPAGNQTVRSNDDASLSVASPLKSNAAVESIAQDESGSDSVLQSPETRMIVSPIAVQSSTVTNVVPSNVASRAMVSVGNPKRKLLRRKGKLNEKTLRGEPCIGTTTYFFLQNSVLCLTFLFGDVRQRVHVL